MGISKRIYLIFLISILIPGFILGYLSLRAVQTERQLLRQVQKAGNNDFMDYLEQLIQKNENQYLKEVKELLIHSSASASEKNYFFLSSDLLKLPFIKSLVIIEKDSLAFPRHISTSFAPNATPALPFRSMYPHAAVTLKAIHSLYKNKQYANCLRAINSFRFYSPNGNISGPLASPYHYGLGLLSIKCHRNLGQDIQAIQIGQSLIEDMIITRDIHTISQLEFYLNEIITILTSFENLEKQVSDYIWSVSTRMGAFLNNARFVYEEWRPEADFLMQLKGKEYVKGLDIFYIEGTPFLKISHPWIDSRSTLVAMINEDLFKQIIEKETLKSQKGLWKHKEYAILNLNDVSVFSPYGMDSKTIAESRILDSDILQWKILVYIAEHDDRIKAGKKKIALLYGLLSFSLIILALGILGTLKALLDERRVVKMKSNFLSAVTHELKTPLTSIRMLSELLESGRQSEANKIRKYASHISQESNRLQSMIENILNTTKLEDNASHFPKKAVNLSALITDTATLMNNSFTKSNIKLSLFVDDDCIVWGSHEALRSVLQNILDNSLKYSQSDSTVSVHLSRQHDNIILRIKDQGIGISQDSQKHIFEKFYRVEDEMTRQTKGSGLGLAIVRQILTYHKADISVKSELNKGSEFTITFTAFRERKNVS